MALEKCDKEIADNTTIAHEYCRNTARNGFDLCIEDCFSAEDDCKGDC
jgi:hypothetical protein